MIKTVNRAAYELGKLGGQSTLKKYGKKHFSVIRQKAWDRKKAKQAPVDNSEQTP